MKLWKVLQLVLAVYGVWSISQGFSVSRGAVEEHCKSADVQEHQLFSYHAPIALHLAHSPDAPHAGVEQISPLTLERVRNEEHFIF